MTLALNHKKNGKTHCAICGYKASRAALEVHHIDGNHNNNDAGNLLVLCRLCHVEAHEKRKGRAPNTLITSVGKRTWEDSNHKEGIVKTIAVDDMDHKRFKQISLDQETPMNELFHQWVEQHNNGGDKK